MTVVIDTNVYLSHFRFGGLPTRVCLFCLEEADVFVSDFLVDETLRILSDKFGLSTDQLTVVAETLQETTQHTNPTNALPALCRDPDDNHILQLAEFVGADYLITGDKDLLVLDPFGPCRIVSPKTFAQAVGLA